MGWFYPSKDHAQHIYQCMPCVYVGPPHQGKLSWTWGGEWERQQEYLESTNIVLTRVRSQAFGLQLEFMDIVPADHAALLRQITVRNLSHRPSNVTVFHYAD